MQGWKLNKAILCLYKNIASIQNFWYSIVINILYILWLIMGQLEIYLQVMIQ